MYYKDRWYDTMPKLTIIKNCHQKRNSQSLRKFKKQLSKWVKVTTKAEDLQDTLAQNHLKSLIIPFMDQTLEVDSWVCELLDQEDYYETTQAFIERARKEHPNMVFDDIFQALRNLWVIISLQLYMNCKVELTDAIYGYSMLYPLTDNYLDDVTIPLAEKKAFNQRFHKKISEGSIQPVNEQESHIFGMIDLIHTTYPRNHYPEVTNSLLAILDAQNKSLCQQDLTSLYEVDLHALTFYKGGTSVLADAYLVNGTLSENQAQLAYGYGTILQLADDLQDLGTDLISHHGTMMTTQGTFDTLDGLTMHYMAFIEDFFNDIYIASTQKQIGLKQLLMVSVELLLYSAINEQTPHYSKDFIKHYNKKSRFSKKSYNFLNNRLINQIKELL